MFDRKSLVINTHQMQDSGIQIANMHRILNDVVAKIIRLAAAYAAAGEPHAVAFWMMVAPIFFSLECPLAVNRAPELTAPNEQRIVQQAATLEVLDQSPSRLINFLGLPANILGQITVMIPAAVKDLYKIETPRSVMRRASRQLLPNVPDLVASDPYRSRMC